MQQKTQKSKHIILVLVLVGLVICLAGFSGTAKAFSLANPFVVNLATSSAFSFLLVGDSFMDTYSPVGDFLKKTLSSLKGVLVNRVGKVSSGLARPDFFNWSAKAQELVNLYKPNVVVAMLGANDDQPLKVTDANGQKKFLIFGTGEWQAEYSRRVSDFIKIFQRQKATVFWVGLPVMRDKARAERMKIINSVCQATINNNLKGAFFVPTWPILSNAKGEYTDVLINQNGQKVASHAPDGIHLSYFAGIALVKKLVREMASQLPLAFLIK
jgi:hypothetical protein